LCGPAGTAKSRTGGSVGSAPRLTGTRFTDSLRRCLARLLATIRAGNVRPSSRIGRGHKQRGATISRPVRLPMRSFEWRRALRIVPRSSDTSFSESASPSGPTAVAEPAPEPARSAPGKLGGCVRPCHLGGIRPDVVAGAHRL